MKNQEATSSDAAELDSKIWYEINSKMANYIKAASKKQIDTLKSVYGYSSSQINNLKKRLPIFKTDTSLEIRNIDNSPLTSIWYKKKALEDIVRGNMSYKRIRMKYPIPKEIKDVLIETINSKLNDKIEIAKALSIEAID